MSKKDIEKAVNKLVGDLGVNDTYELLAFALPHITKRHEELQDALERGEWETAARCAHKTLSSVRLYGSERLEVLLYQVREAGTGGMDVPALRQELSVEFLSVIQTIKEWLNVNSA